tara:strand:+ start:1340 stop:3043 length:1704 start_codon:yes stop_codon:yes gene_type:complete
VTNIFRILFLLSTILGQSIQISVDRNQITINDLITLSIEVSGTNSFPDVNMDPIKNEFIIVSGPGQQTNVQWINGKMTSTRTLTWTISPKREGTLFIPVISGKVDGKSFRGKKIKIVVSKNSDNKNNDVFLVAEVDKDKAYLGQQITVSYKLYKRINISIEPFQMPEFQGFWVEHLFSPKRLQYRNVNLKGVKYQVASLGQMALFPLSAEKHIIPSLKIQAQVELKKNKRRHDPFFDPFFDSFFKETSTKYLVSDRQEISILPFPDPRPFDFSGAVGIFKVKSITDRDTARVNEGFTFTITMQGSGNLGLFSIPEIKFPDQLEAFPPTENFNKDVFRDAISGTQTWEYILIPRVSGIITIPRIQMSYFHPDKKKWVRTKTDPIDIPILPDKKSIIESSGFTKKEVELIGQDIRFIHNSISGFNQIGKSKSFVLVLIIYILSILIFIFPIFLSKVIGYRISTQESRRSRSALKIALKELKKSNDDPFETASGAIYLYLKNKFLLSSRNLDPSIVENLLGFRINEEISEELIDLLKDCDAGRFAPGALEREPKILTDTKVILKKIDQQL